MRVETKNLARFKKVDGKMPSSLIHQGKYIFSGMEARYKYGLVGETEEYTLQYVYYSDNPADMKAAFEFMPNYELWDSERRVLGKEVK